MCYCPPCCIIETEKSNLQDAELILSCITRDAVKYDGEDAVMGAEALLDT